MNSVLGLAQPLPARVRCLCRSPGARLAPKSGMHPVLLTPFTLQMLTLVTSLRNDDSKRLQNNYRLAQDLHGRRVLASFQTTLPLPKHQPSPGKACVSVLSLHLDAGMGRGAGAKASRLLQKCSVCTGLALTGR